MSRTADGARCVALVTGAARGIGAATARLLGRSGMAVAVNYLRDEAAAGAVAEDITAHGGAALAVQADVTDDAAVRVMLERVEGGLGPVDVLVCNAGQNAPRCAATRWPTMSAGRSRSWPATRPGS